MGFGVKCQGMQGDGRESVQCARGIQGNAGECQGNAWEWVQSAMGIPGERMGECAKC